MSDLNIKKINILQNELKILKTLLKYIKKNLLNKQIFKNYII